MANIKTAISIEEQLFQRISELAQQLNISRSRFFALATKEFIERHQNLELLEALNEAYDKDSDADSTVANMRKKHREVVTDQW